MKLFDFSGSESHIFLVGASSKKVRGVGSRGCSWRHRYPADVAPSSAAHRACLSCSPKSDSPSLLYSSAILVVPVCSSSIDPRLSSRPSSHATISAVPLHGCLHRRAIPAAAASADDRRPLGVAAQAQAGILHGHGRRRRLAREDAAAGRGPGGAHLAASPQLVSCTPSRPFTTTYICWPCSALKLLGKRKKYNRW